MTSRISRQNVGKFTRTPLEVGMHLIKCSLHCKRFRGLSEQRKIEESDSDGLPREKHFLLSSDFSHGHTNRIAFLNLSLLNRVQSSTYLSLYMKPDLSYLSLHMKPRWLY